MDSCKLIAENIPTHSSRNSKLVFGLCVCVCLYVCVCVYVGLLDGQKTTLSSGPQPRRRGTFGYREKCQMCRQLSLLLTFRPSRGAAKYRLLRVLRGKKS